MQIADPELLASDPKIGPPFLQKRTHTSALTHTHTVHIPTTPGRQRAQESSFTVCLHGHLRFHNYSRSDRIGYRSRERLFWILPIELPGKIFNISPISGRTVGSQESVQNTAAEKKGGLKWLDGQGSEVRLVSEHRKPTGTQARSGCNRGPQKTIPYCTTPPE